MKGSMVTTLLLALAWSAHGSDTQLKEANRLFRAEKYEAALKLYNDALVDAPDSSILRFNVGDAAYQMGNFSQAEKDFAEVADKTPIPPLKSAARYNQGNALFRQRKWAEAVEAYKEALRANPHDENAKYNLGVALQTQKNPPPPPKPDKSQGGQGQAKGREDQKKKSDMSKDDAQRLLSAAGAGEQKPNAKAPKGGVKAPDEDW